MKHSARLLSANVMAQVIGLAVYPLLTRLYSSADFGLLHLFLSIGGVLVLLACCEYHYAVVLPHDEERSLALVRWTVVLVTAMTVLLLLTLPLSGVIADGFEVPELARWWWLMPLFVLFSGLWNVLNYWYIHTTRFKHIGAYQVSLSVLSAGNKLGFGYAGWLRGGLVLSVVIAPLVALLMQLAAMGRELISLFKTWDWQQMRRVAREYKNFPLFNLPRALVNTFGASLPVWLLTPYFGLELVGYFSLAITAAFLPMNIIARSCYQVLYGQVADMVGQHQPVRGLVAKFVLWTALPLLFVLPVIYLFVPELVSLLFGAGWEMTAEVIRRLFPYVALTPLCGALCFVSDVFMRQKMAMWLEVGLKSESNTSIEYLSYSPSLT